jgi:type IV pilus assembly protein PilV
MKKHQYAAALSPKVQSGFVLLDAVIAILIFSIGILGMVALQGSAIKLAGDAQFRTNAAMFADQVIAQMWGDYDPVNYPTGSQLTTDYSSPSGAKYLVWKTTLDCSTAAAAVPCLPGVTANPPTIVIQNADTTGGKSPSSLVTVTVFWKSPNDTGPHQYVSVTQISR